MPLWTKIATGFALIAIVAIAYALFGRSPPPPPPTYAQAAQSLVQFDGQLAQVALDQLGDLPGLGVRPTDAELPIGTLFIPGRSLDLDEDSCRADPVPTAYPASAFPDFQVQDAVAASVGLSPAVTRSLVNAGAQIAQGNTITIHFDVLRRQYLDDHKLAELLKRPACLAALSDGPVSMIRGYFRGQRSFVLSTTETGKLNASLAKIANFDVSRDSGNSSVVLKDPSDFGFLQLYTQVAVTAAPISPGQVVPPTHKPEPDQPATEHKYHHARAGPPETAPPVATPAASVVTVAAAPIAAHGRVYIQRDALDMSHADSVVAAALSHAGFPVVPKVEQVPTRKMPTTAQVRYFNATDLASATKALGVLQVTFPGAQLRRIALPSPNGQLEIWLPKAMS